MNGMISEPLMPVLTLNKFYFYYRFILLTLNGDPSSHFGITDASNGVKDLLGRTASFPEHAISYIRREGKFSRGAAVAFATAFIPIKV